MKRDNLVHGCICMIPSIVILSSAISSFQDRRESAKEKGLTQIAIRILHLPTFFFVFLIRFFLPILDITSDS